MGKKEENLECHGSPHSYSWVSDFVYGGIDGAVTTFAVVAGVEGASLSVPIILILGFANLFADGFSMSIGKYSSDKAQIDEYEKIKRIEYQHIKERAEHEKLEVEEILKRYAFEGKDLKRAVEVVTSDEDAWVDLMMRNEFNLAIEGVNPVKGGVITFVSFLTIGFIPLIGYVFAPLLKLDANNSFLFAVGATMLALFIVGAVKSRFSVRHWFLSAMETVFIGGVAAIIAYGVGYALRGLG